MGAKHTPGPWGVEDGILKPGGIAVVAGDYGIAKVWNYQPGHGAENAANARLIAAAPDLLAVLRELVGQRDAHFHTVSAWDAARAAIAKAEGSE